MASLRLQHVRSALNSWAAPAAAGDSGLPIVAIIDMENKDGTIYSGAGDDTIELDELRGTAKVSRNLPACCLLLAAPHLLRASHTNHSCLLLPPPPPPPPPTPPPLLAGGLHRRCQHRGGGPGATCGSQRSAAATLSVRRGAARQTAQAQGHPAHGRRLRQRGHCGLHCGGRDCLQLPGRMGGRGRRLDPLPDDCTDPPHL